MNIFLKNLKYLLLILLSIIAIQILPDPLQEQWLEVQFISFFICWLISFAANLLLLHYLFRKEQNFLNKTVKFFTTIYCILQVLLCFVLLSLPLVFILLVDYFTHLYQFVIIFYLVLPIILHDKKILLTIQIKRYLLVTISSILLLIASIPLSKEWAEQVHYHEDGKGPVNIN